MTALRFVRVHVRSPNAKWVSHQEDTPMDYVRSGVELNSGGYSGVATVNVFYNSGWYTTVGGTPYDAAGKLNMWTGLPLTVNRNGVGPPEPPTPQYLWPWATFAYVFKRDPVLNDATLYTGSDLDAIMGAQQQWSQRRHYDSANHYSYLSDQVGIYVLPDNYDQVIIARMQFDQVGSSGSGAYLDERYAKGGLDFQDPQGNRLVRMQFKVRCTWGVLYDKLTASSEFRASLPYTRFRFYTGRPIFVPDVDIDGLTRRYSSGSSGYDDVDFPDQQQILQIGVLPAVHEEPGPGSGYEQMVATDTVVLTRTYTAADMGYGDFTSFGVHIVDFPILDGYSQYSHNVVSALPSVVSYQAAMELMSVRVQWTNTDDINAPLPPLF